MSASAQIEIRPDHPRIFFNAETWPAIKERAYGENRAYLDKLLDEVNQMTDDPVAKNTGPIEVKDRSLPIAPVKEFGREAASCALAWRFTGKEKYLEKAKSEDKVIFGGRLGMYRYFDMHQVVEEALKCVKETI